MSDLPLWGPQGEPGTSASPPVVRQILVPDAGVGVKWFVPEPDADKAERLLDAQFELHTPSYFFTVLAVALGGRVVTADRRLYNGVHGGPLDHVVLWVADPL